MSNEKKESLTVPRAAKKGHKLEAHGQVRTDEYYWLNQREDQEVLDYLNAENEYTKAILKDTEQFQNKLFEEIKGRIKQEDSSVPYIHNGYWYYERYSEGKEYPVYCRKKGSLESAEEIIIDVNELAEGFEYYQVGSLEVSPDNRWAAYGVDTVSRRIYTIHFKNLETGETLSETIPGTTGGADWANDNQTIFYSVRDEALRPHKIMKHKLGTDASKDKEVYVEEDERFVCYVDKTKSEQYLMITSDSTMTTEFRLLNADEPDGEFKVFHPRERGLEYSITHHNDFFWVLTNWDAPNFRLMKAPIDNTGKENWEEFIGHREDTRIEEVETFEKFLVVEERRGGLIHMKVIELESGNEHYMDFDEEVYTAYGSINLEIDTEIFRFGYTSMTTPSSVFDYNMVTKERVLLKQQEVVGDFNKDEYVTKRVFANAIDGTLVPISLVHRVDTTLGEQTPLLLYGYGSYGHSIDPAFSSVRLSLLDRGFVFAIAHIRGGEEMGRNWYEDGKLLKKMNTFTDFISCAEFLIAENYTSPKHLYAMGGSAGGLLMGPVINLRPDLFNGIVAAVPFVDVVTTMLDDTIPLTTGEYDEWGNPNEKEYYEYILSYSPYDNVEKKEYPNMMVTTGLHDSQVQYWEPAKWVAKLREYKTDNNALVLYTDMETGHSGASGRFKRYRDVALEYGFILSLENINS